MGFTRQHLNLPVTGDGYGQTFKSGSFRKSFYSDPNYYSLTLCLRTWSARSALNRG